MAGTDLKGMTLPCLVAVDIHFTLCQDIPAHLNTNLAEQPYIFPQLCWIQTIPFAFATILLTYCCCGIPFATSELKTIV